MSGPLVIGHRGMGISGESSENPENSIEGFRSALRAGADGVELDVQFSIDGEAVVYHDSKLGRVTQVADLRGKRLVSQLTSDELSEVRLTGDESSVIPMLPQVLHEIRDELDGTSLRLPPGSSTVKSRSIVSCARMSTISSPTCQSPACSIRQAID